MSVSEIIALRVRKSGLHLLLCNDGHIILSGQNRNTLQTHKVLENIILEDTKWED